MRLPKGLVCAPQPLAVEAGAQIFAAGGNAFDAAVATAFAQGVVDPQMCGIGGGGTATVQHADSAEPLSLDFYARVPLAARPDMFESRIAGDAPWGGVVLSDRANEIGYESLCTPGAVRGYAALHRRGGKLPWAEVLAPAIDIARSGPPVYHHVYDRWMRPAKGYVDSLTRHSATPACARQYMREGRMLEPGERMNTAQYADTLIRLAEAGAEDFYIGDIAQTIARDMQGHGGLIDADDLARMDTPERRPITGWAADWRLYGPPQPGAGILLAQVLALLETLGIDEARHNGADYLDKLARALAHGFADWRAHTGDPDFVDDRTDWLLSEARREQLAERIRAGQDPAPLAGIPDGRDTTHLSVIDAEGNAVSMTHTLALGSGVVTDGLGFMYNNAMMLFDPRPGGTNSIAPRRIRQHATSCCILKGPKGETLAVGAPGGYGIVSGVVQTILNMLVNRMTPAEAVSAARIHCEGPEVDCEARIPTATIAELKRRGLAPRHSVFSYDYASGRPHVAVRYADGSLGGGADPRAGGMTLTDLDLG
jgi:gamma-glutamyltranspeptidase/glutathione hydrolase